jgi:hypothetical protein
MVYACNPSTREAEARRLRIDGQLGYIARPYFQRKEKIIKT